jgi:hypothetical protein
LTGFSIGPLFLPVAAGAMFWLDRRSPYLLESLGFVGGLAVTAALVTAIH